MKTTTNKMEEKKEYWVDSGETCFMETKDEFYNAIHAGFRGFIKYESGKIFWVK